MSVPIGTFIVTGCRAGLGKEIASCFLSSSEGSSHAGLFGVRAPASATELQALVTKSPHPELHHVVTIDLSTLDAVRAAAKDINDRVTARELPPIRALVLNAAVQYVTGQTFTEDGLEATFAVNYLANFLLTLLLLPSFDKEMGRIVIMSSWTHEVTHPLNSFIEEESHKTIVKGNLDDLAKPQVADGKGSEWGQGMRRYGMSKFLLLMFMYMTVSASPTGLYLPDDRYKLQRLLSTSAELSNVSVLAVDPGAMPGTGLLRDSSVVLKIMVHWVGGLLTPLLTWWSPNGFFRTPAKSAKDVFNACFDENTLGRHPQAVYLNGSEKATSSTETQDEEKQDRLWEWSVSMADLQWSETAVQLA